MVAYRHDRGTAAAPSVEEAWGPGRAAYLLERHRANQARLLLAQAEVEIVQQRLGEARRELTRLEAGWADGPAAPVDVDAKGDLSASIERLEHELLAARDAAVPRQTDLVTEWLVHNDTKPPPSPGRLLLARRSKKPYPPQRR